MSEKILLVDDDINILAAYERILRRLFQVETAVNGEIGLRKFAAGSHAVVVSDRHMPGMDGVAFLAQVRQRAPDSVRIMVTGNVDLEQAVQVVNEGNVFRFLIKPCSSETLIATLQDAVKQYRLITAEKELLGKTLKGAIKLLTDIIASLDATSAGRVDKLRHIVKQVAGKAGLGEAWDVHLAVMLSSIGSVTLPPGVLARAHEGKPLSPKEKQLVRDLPEISARLLSHIPRLESVAKIVRYQEKQFDGGGFPADALKGEAIPPASRLLKILNDLAAAEADSVTLAQAREKLRLNHGFYDPKLLELVFGCYAASNETRTEARTVGLKANELQPGMVVAEPILTTSEYLILAAGHMLNETTIEKIQNFADLMGIKEPVYIKADSISADANNGEVSQEQKEPVAVAG
jgi:response regulator RpfG family c-di-GMP phosphodiesterase